MESLVVVCIDMVLVEENQLLLTWVTWKLSWLILLLVITKTISKIIGEADVWLHETVTPVVTDIHANGVFKNNPSGKVNLWSGGDWEYGDLGWCGHCDSYACQEILHLKGII